MKEPKSYLIKDTTREQRIAIVRRSLHCTGACDNCMGCSGGLDPWEMYEPYIEGEKEIREINMEYRTSYGIHLSVK